MEPAGSPAAPASSPARQLLATVADAWTVDRAGLLPRHGIRAALALAGAMAVGLVTGGPVDAVLVGAGALVVGSSSLPTGTGIPLGTTVGAALAVALSTFVGAATGPVEPLHVAMLVVWCLAAGMLVALGPAATTVGVQAVVGMVVFGRFGGPVPASAHLALLVLAGASAQVALAAVEWFLEGPAAARRLVSDLYRALAGQARGAVDDVAVAEVADAAEASLLAAEIGGRSGAAATGLRSLVAEGRRIRQSLLAEAGRGVPGPGGPGGAWWEAVPGVAPALEAVADALVTRGGGDAVRVPAPAPPAVTPEALAGQLRAAQSLVADLPALRSRRRPVAGPPRPRNGLPPRRAVPGRVASWRRRWSTQATAAVAALRAGTARDAPAWRHAARLAVVVPLADVMASAAGLPRSYWVALTAALVLKPDYGSTVGRGAARALGTGAGVLVAGLLAATLHPGPAATVAVVSVLSALAFTSFRASYTAFSAMLTAVVVFLLGSIEPGGMPLALDRLADTALGAGLALGAYAVWPTWSAPQATRRVAALVHAQRRYLDCVLSAWLADPVGDGPPAVGERTGAGTGRPAPGGAAARRAGAARAVRAGAARAVRQATAEAVQAVRRSLAEPAAQRVDAVVALGVLDALRRVTLAAAPLRAVADRVPGPGSLPPGGPEALASWAAELDRRLADLAAGVEQQGLMAGRPSSSTGDGGRLRRAQLALAERLAVGPVDGGERDPGAVLVDQSDAVVDAVNTAAALVGR